MLASRRSGEATERMRHKPPSAREPVSRPLALLCLASCYGYQSALKSFVPIFSIKSVGLEDPYLCVGTLLWTGSRFPQKAADSSTTGPATDA